MNMVSSFMRARRAYRSLNPLTEDELRAVAPSIFAPDKHASRSPRYTYIPTAQVLKGLAQEGFAPYMVAQCLSRDAAQREHTKHLVRLRAPGESGEGDAHEVILVNSHNGSSSYQMLAGSFRFVCMNGLVIGDIAADIRLPHKGDVVSAVIEGALTVATRFAAIDERVDAMRSIELSPGQQLLFAERAVGIRFAAEPGKPATTVDPQAVLMARRTEDCRADLWTVFNRVQEALVGGGLQARSARMRRMTTRPIEGIDANLRINRLLWQLAVRTCEEQEVV